LALLLGATLLETVGIGLLVPLLGLLSDPGMLRRIPLIAELIPQGDLQVTMASAVTFGILAVSFYIGKALCLAWIVRRQMAFAFGVQADISRRIFESYLSRPYLFHMATNSAQLINTSLGEVQVFTNGVVIAGVSLIAEALVLVSVSALLLLIEPFAALASAAVLGTVAAGFYALVRSRLRLWGAKRPIHEAQRLQHLQQGLSTVKELILSGREREFVRRYDESNRGVAGIMWREKALSHVPRLGLEVFAVISVLLVIVVLLGQGREPVEIVPRVAVFAVACLRIVPSLNRMSNSLQSLRFAAPAAAAITSELARSLERPPPPPVPLKWSNLIEAKAASFDYGKATAPVLQSVNLTIRRGERVGVIGSSGSGKTTLVNLLTGLILPVQGTIEVDGADVRTCLREWRAQVGYVPQSIVLSDDTLLRNIAFGESDDDIDESRAMEVARLAQLASFIGSSPDGLRARPGERGSRLSGGQLQRIGIARALYRAPSLLILDEATSALDQATESEVLASIVALPRDITVLVVTHRPSALAVCDRVIRIDGGRVRELSHDERVTLASSEANQ
jgi:ABC-type multidrug transport system fused ATPase/permease subunit